MSPAARRFGIAFLLAALLATRFWDLGAKPYHHDEGIYATLSFRLAQSFDYRFDPITHGPFLYFSQAPLFKIFGASDFTGRLPVAIAGVGLVLAGLAVLRRRPAPERVAWLALATLSPVLAYFSRFLGMDVPMAALAVGLLAAFARFLETGRARWFYLAALILACMACLKLNWLFYFGAFVSFVIVARDRDTAMRITPTQWVNALNIGLFVFAALYSSLGTNPAGIWDGVFGKMLPYWIGQNRVQRIAGPFHYYLTLVGIYELPLVISLAYVLARTVPASAARRIWIGGGAATLALLALGAALWKNSVFLRQHLHMDAFFHPALLALELTAWAAQLRFHLGRGEKLEAFFSHWTWTSLILYSYAGEKIPWLTVHVVVPALFYAAVTLPRLLGARWTYAIAGAALAWQGFVLVRATELRAADPAERLVYTHTTPELLAFVDRVDAAREAGRPVNLQVSGYCQGVWPLSWYLRDQKAWFRPTLDIAGQADVYVGDWEQRDPLQAQLGPEYSPRRLPLRAWWIPDPAQYSVANFARYYFARDVFGPKGSTDLVAFIRNDRMAAFDGAPAPAP